MKSKLFTLVILISSIYLLAEQVSISIDIPGESEEQIIIYPTVDGFYYEAAVQFIRTDSLGRANITFDTEKSGFCYLIFHNGRYFKYWNVLQFYIYPGEEYKISLTNPKNPSIWNIRGANEVENKFLLERQRIDLRKHQSRRELEYFISDQDEEGWYQKVMAMRELELLEIGVLERTGAVSLEFAKDVKADIQYYYACLIHQLLAKTSLFIKIEDEDQKAMVTLMIENEIHTADQYANEAPASKWYIEYLRQRMTYYTISNQKVLADHYRNYPNYTEAYWNLLYEFMNEMEFEVFLAHHILFLKKNRQLDKNVIQLYRRFRAEFPSSVFLRQLERIIEPEISKMVSPGQ